MNKDSFNIPMSFKINEYLLKQLHQFCIAEQQSYSAMIRAGISMLLAKRYKDNTNNTSNPRVAW